jgi:hypothetical protein
MGMKRTTDRNWRLCLESLETRQLLTALPLTAASLPDLADHAAIVAPSVKYPQLTGKAFVGTGNSDGYPLTSISVTFLTQHGAKLTGVLTQKVPDSRADTATKKPTRRVLPVGFPRTTETALVIPKAISPWSGVTTYYRLAHPLAITTPPGI